MKAEPALTAVTIDQIAPGDLFFYCSMNTTTVALRTVDPQLENRYESLLIGPHFPGELKHPFFTQMPPEGIVLLGKEYTLDLSTDPDMWTTQAPVGLGLYVVKDNFFFRMNPHPERVPHYVYVSLENGTVLEKYPGSGMFCHKWKIGFKDERDQFRLIYAGPSAT